MSTRTYWIVRPESEGEGDPFALLIVKSRSGACPASFNVVEGPYTNYTTAKRALMAAFTEVRRLLAYRLRAVRAMREASVEDWTPEEDTEEPQESEWLSVTDTRTEARQPPY